MHKKEDSRSKKILITKSSKKFLMNNCNSSKIGNDTHSLLEKNAKFNKLLIECLFARRLDNFAKKEMYQLNLADIRRNWPWYK